MKSQSDLKELSKQKCSTKGCKNKAESIIGKVVYCNYCIKNFKEENKEQRKDFIEEIRKRNEK